MEEVEISCNLLAVGVEDPEVLAINAASMVLAMSSVPWQVAVGAVRVVWAGRRVLINPAMKELGPVRLTWCWWGPVRGSAP